MRRFREKVSITKLVFLIVMVCLCIFTGYQFYRGYEIQNKLRESVVTSCISFYFGQKAVKYPEADSLIKEEKKE